MSVHPSVCQSFIYLSALVYPSNYLSDYLSIYLSIHHSIIHPSTCLSIQLFIQLSIQLSFRLSIFLSVHPFICLSVCLSVNATIYLSIYPFVCPSICLSIHLFVHLQIYLYILLSQLNLTAGLFTDSTPASHSEISENLISIMKEPTGSGGGAQSAALARVNTGRSGREAERRAAARSNGRSIA